MPTFVTGNMWDVFHDTEWFLITTNPIINKQGLAVMGRGIAKEAADRFPRLRLEFAEQLCQRKLRESNVFTIGRYDGTRVGCFMVKNHWKERARLDIIEKSVQDLLSTLATITDIRGYSPRVDLNFPGVGNGGLDKEDVRPLLMCLPDNVHIWSYE